MNDEGYAVYGFHTAKALRELNDFQCF
jgi:hypothetical protein